MNSRSISLMEGDMEIIALLKRHDPAGYVALGTTAAIEMHVMARVARPSLIQRVEQALVELLPDLRLGGLRLSWPVIGASAVAFGLIIGMMSASVIEEPASTASQTYVLSEVLPQPWE